ncbi:MAG TPA: nucleoside triphosphate pyrophosphohydrolase [Patescibacteria group bacterium]|nr:nucleoside triphosphate pyrophosphohydrolase [Patescibacteria group bacterium]
MTFIHTDTELPIEDKYPKLIRDKIPELVESQGKTAKTRVMKDDEEYLKYLLAKLIEEATELAHAETSHNQEEELADVYEVLSAVLELLELEQSDITSVQNEKRQKRGGFKKKLLMLVKPE